MKPYERLRNIARGDERVKIRGHDIDLGELR